MSVRYRLVLFLLALALFVLVGRLVTGSFSFTYADFWFTSGILLLILLSLVDQPHFSKDANIFVNGVTGLVALLTVAPPDRNPLWHLFFTWSFYLVASSYLVMYLRRRELTNEALWLRLVSRVNREIGRPEVLFSAFFVWGLVSQFGSDSHELRSLTLFWGIYIVLNIPGIARGLDQTLSRKPSTDPVAIGSILSITSPRIIEVKVRSDAPRRLVGRPVNVTCGSYGVCARATVIDDRVMSRLRIARLAITDTTDQWPHLSDDSLASPGAVYLAAENEETAIPVSVVDRGSDIGSLRFYTNPVISLQEGEVVWTKLADGDHAYYQIVAATITEESLGSPHSAHSVVVTASQLGVWKPDACRFEPISWVAQAGELVWRVASDARAAGEIPIGHVKLGQVPNSAFPVHANLEDLVTHNTAILGVTGSGKSYLSFQIVEALLASNIKVLVLDLTRQHFTFLRHRSPSAIKSEREVKGWLESDSLLGIYQFAQSTSHPASTASFVGEAFKHCESRVKLRAGENEPARLCIVLEEAHSLIPEWNQVAQKEDTASVNSTARLLLQGRKFGMGCILISQRTANVTKTILNQCNSIFALQSFDQTGLDFLRNYMGADYAHAISTLPARHAVLVGKASSSARPILLRIEDLSGFWTSPESPAPPVPVDEMDRLSNELATEA